MVDLHCTSESEHCVASLGLGAETHLCQHCGRLLIESDAAVDARRRMRSERVVGSDGKSIVASLFWSELESGRRPLEILWTVMRMKAILHLVTEHG